MRALISVSNKSGIVDFAKGLEKLGVEIISTGGTYSLLKENGINAISIEEITNFKECLDGRVKTLHPNIHSGILAIRENEKHLKEIESLNIDFIDIVIVNLYPFKETILKNNVSLEEAIENIDIGGPTMIRAASKNYKYVSAVTSPEDYNKILDEIQKNGKVSEKTNFYLSVKAFSHTAHYDAIISNYLKQKCDYPKYDDVITMTFEKVQSMRYGENPHQNACFYKEVKNNMGMLTSFTQIQGKEMSFNNINDTNGALELLKEFSEPTIVACKHSSPCGVGSGENIFEAYQKAYLADSTSIFGGIVVSNREICENTAKEMTKIFLEVVVAPSFTKEALEEFSKKSNLRVLKIEDICKKQDELSFDLKKVSGGILIQDIDNTLVCDSEMKVVTNRKPTEKEMEDLLFAFKVVKFTKSNAIVLAKNKQTIGIGNGQVNRIWATKQAIEHAKEQIDENICKNSVLASDAFFPFDDCVREAIKEGVTAIIQPGGSIRDEDSIKLCNENNIAMVFTNVRHFRH